MRRIILLIVVLALATPAVASAQDGPLATVTAPALNVRAGPGADYPILGQLSRGARLRLSGRTVDSNWLFFSYWDQPGWVAARYLAVAGDVATLPVVGDQPLPSPEIEIPPLPDLPAIRLRVASAAVNPPTPRPGQSFEVQITLINDGTATAGLFSLAVVFAPLDHFSYATVPYLGAGEAIVVTLPVPGIDATGRYSSPLLLDIDRQLDMSEQARQQAIAYSIDKPIIAQGSLIMAPYTNIDLHGDLPDLAFDASRLTALNGARLDLLDYPLSDLHFDRLSAVDGEALETWRLAPGAIIGVITAEGRRGWLRIGRQTDAGLEVHYAVYAR